MQTQEDKFKETSVQLAKMEIENEEYKNDVRNMGYMVEDYEQKLDSQLEMNELLATEQEEMKSHLEEQIERYRQQLDECQTELMVKEKELKKIKFNQLMIDTQANLVQNQSSIRNLNHTVRHSKTPNHANDFQEIIHPQLSARNNRAEVMQKLKEPVGSKKRDKENISEAPPKKDSAKRSVQSGELDNTSEKSAKQKIEDHPDKSENGPGPAPDLPESKLSRSQNQEHETHSTNNKDLSPPNET